MRSGKQSGVTLIEIMLVLIILGLGGALVVPQFVKRAQRNKDIDAAVSLLEYAVSLSLTKGVSHEFHWDSANGRAGIYQKCVIDQANLIRKERFDPGARISIANADDSIVSGICFAADGSVENEQTHRITLTSARGKAAVFDIIAATGKAVRRQ